MSSLGLCSLLILIFLSCFMIAKEEIGEQIEQVETSTVNADLPASYDDSRRHHGGMGIHYDIPQRHHGGMGIHHRRPFRHHGGFGIHYREDLFKYPNTPSKVIVIPHPRRFYHPFSIETQERDSEEEPSEETSGEEE